MIRILSFFIILASIFLFPWWVGAVIALICAFNFALYAEVVFFGIVIDAIYGYGGGIHRFAFTFIAIIVLILVPFIKSKMHMRS